VDALRDGRMRERKLAEQELKKKLVQEGRWLTEIWNSS
jgi:hypothetical protein